MITLVGACIARDGAGYRETSDHVALVAAMVKPGMAQP